jgi:hypothetical protein
MGLLRIDRILARFNRRVEGTAAAASIEPHGGAGTGGPTAAAAGLPQTETETAAEAEAEPPDDGSQSA